jgi:hypothetical protein
VTGPDRSECSLRYNLGGRMHSAARAMRTMGGVAVATVLTVAAVGAAGPVAAATTPTVSIPATVLKPVEGNAGTTATVTLTAKLDVASTATVTVAYATVDGTAKASDSDYTAKSGTLTFAPGVTSQPITVTLKGDAKLEDLETFSVTLSAPKNAVLGNATEKLQILNDEHPQLVLGDAVVTEGQTASFVPKLVQRYYQPVVFGVFTTNGTATAPADYSSVLVSRTIATGAKNATAVTVPTVADGVPEAGETFTVTAAGDTLAATTVATGTLAWNLASATFPIRGAFYYGWFPGNWSAGSVYHPTLGQYSSGSPSVIAQHIAWMQRAKVRVGIASWWGPGHATDANLTAELAAARGTGFQWAAYYEAEGYGSPTATKIGNDLAALWARAQDPAWLHVAGRPVIFVYGGDAEACSTVARWKNAPGSANWFVVMKVFTGFASCASQPDDWHQYAPANATQSHLPYSYVISPGFWKFGETAPRLVRDTTRWAQNVRSMVASGARWQLVTTFNEWGEGTGVEPTTEFGTAYLDTLATDGN